MRRAAKVDENQNEIVSFLRAIGCRVQLLTSVGSGCPDLLVGTPAPRRQLILIEIKDGKRKASKLNEAQVEFFREWQQYPVVMVKTLDEARQVIAEYSGRVDRTPMPTGLQQPQFASDAPTQEKTPDLKD